MSKFNITKSRSASQSSMRRSTRGTSLQGTSKFFEEFKTTIGNDYQPQVFVDGKPMFVTYDTELPVVNIYEHSKRVVLRSNSITEEVVEALVTSLLCGARMSDLRLEFCNLDASHLETLASFLRQDKSVRFLSVRGNCGISAHLHTLLDGTDIESLSVQLCGVDDESVGKISAALGDFEQKLLNLNLSGNYITDEGIKRLADSLRSNRTLASLNISDNYIGEEGFVYFAHVFKEFPLRHEEIVFRRRKIMERLKKNKDESSPLKMFTTVVDQKRDSSGSPSICRRKTPTLSGGVRRNSSSVSLPDVAGHPFVVDSVPKNMEIVCAGNNTLLNLNISYNNVTVNVLNALIDVVQYQRASFGGMKPTRTGLVRIAVEDVKESRLMPVLSELYRQLSGVEPITEGGNVPT